MGIDIEVEAVAVNSVLSTGAIRRASQCHEFIEGLAQGYAMSDA